MERQYTIKEVAEIIHKTEKTVQRLCRERIIKGSQAVTGSWLISESALRAYQAGATPKEEPTETTGDDKGENPEVKKAEDAQKIAEAKAAEAKADEEYQGHKDTAEKRNRIIAEAVQEAVKKATQQLEDAAVRHKEEADASHAQNVRYEPENTKLRELCGMQKEHIEEQDKLLGIQKEEAAKLVSDTDYYNEHVEQGIRLVAKIAKGISPCDKGLADYLNRQIKGLENGVGYEQGMGIFRACSRNIIKVAGWYQESDGKGKLQYDPSDVADYLCKVDERLVLLMRIPDLRALRRWNSLTLIEQDESDKRVKDLFLTDKEQEALAVAVKRGSK